MTKEQLPWHTHTPRLHPFSHAITHLLLNREMTERGREKERRGRATRLDHVINEPDTNMAEQLEYN